MANGPVGLWVEGRWLALPHKLRATDTKGTPYLLLFSIQNKPENPQLTGGIGTGEHHKGRHIMVSTGWARITQKLSSLACSMAPEQTSLPPSCFAYRLREQYSTCSSGGQANQNFPLSRQTWVKLQPGLPYVPCSGPPALLSGIALFSPGNI